MPKGGGGGGKWGLWCLLPAARGRGAVYMTTAGNASPQQLIVAHLLLSGFVLCLDLESMKGRGGEGRKGERINTAKRRSGKNGCSQFLFYFGVGPKKIPQKM